MCHPTAQSARVGEGTAVWARGQQQVCAHLPACYPEELHGHLIGEEGREKREVLSPRTEALKGVKDLYQASNKGQLERGVAQRVLSERLTDVLR